jgi:hypothetical protein
LIVIGIWFIYISLPWFFTLQLFKTLKPVRKNKNHT